MKLFKSTSRLFLTVILLMVALWVSAQEKQMYVVVSDDVATFYYDNLYENKANNGMYVSKINMTPSYGYGGKDRITKVVFDASFADARPSTTSHWFDSMYALNEITGIEHFNTSKVTDMSKMFYMCTRLTSINLCNLDTKNVKSMNSMFESCVSLKNLDLSNFNTSNVTDMRHMFYECIHLTNINVSNFNTSNVTDMYGMFDDCKSLTSIDVSHFDTSNVTNISVMFFGCSSLTSINVSHFDTSNVTNMYCMFSECSSLISINISNFDTSNITVSTGVGDMFKNCKSLKSLSIGENITQMPSFSDSKKIKRIVSYQKEPYAIASDCFADVVKENAKLYVPNSARTQYTNTDGWKEFKYITAKDLDPEDEDNTRFGMNDIDENTDLNGNIASNVFLNVPAEDGEYNTDDNCIVVKKAMTDEQVNSIIGLDLFDEYLINNFTGLIFMLDAGNGTIELEAETLGNMQLNVKIGDAEPTTQKVNGKSKVSIPYNVTEPTYVYVYGTTSAAKAQGMRSANATENALKLYSIAWGDATGISNINMSADKQATIYNLNGQRVTTPGKGMYIVNGKKVILK